MRKFQALIILGCFIVRLELAKQVNGREQWASIQTPLLTYSISSLLLWDLYQSIERQFNPHYNAYKPFHLALQPLARSYSTMDTFSSFEFISSSNSSQPAAAQTEISCDGELSNPISSSSILVNMEHPEDASSDANFGSFCLIAWKLSTFTTSYVLLPLRPFFDAEVVSLKDANVAWSATCSRGERFRPTIPPSNPTVINHGWSLMGLPVNFFSFSSSLRIIPSVDRKNVVVLSNISHSLGIMDGHLAIYHASGHHLSLIYCIYSYPEMSLFIRIRLHLWKPTL